MDIRILAAILLIARIISDAFILLVIIRQWRLFKFHVQHDLVWFRRVLFILALIIFIGNFIPIFIDGATAFSDLKRSSDTVNPVGIYYAFSNAITATLSALLIWVLYKMAAKAVILQQVADNVAEEKAQNKSSGEV